VHRRALPYRTPTMGVASLILFGVTAAAGAAACLCAVVALTFQYESNGEKLDSLWTLVTSGETWEDATGQGDNDEVSNYLVAAGTLALIAAILGAILVIVTIIMAFASMCNKCGAGCTGFTYFICAVLAALYFIYRADEDITDPLKWLNEAYTGEEDIPLGPTDPDKLADDGFNPLPDQHMIACSLLYMIASICCCIAGSCSTPKAKDQKPPTFTDPAGIQVKQ